MSHLGVTAAIAPPASRLLLAHPEGRWIEPRFRSDEEQTDNYQSPWDTIDSRTHAVWKSVRPKLAALVHPRVRRGFLDVPNALEEAPESMAVGGLDEAAAGGSGSSGWTEVAMCVLKRLLSNEATAFFYHPVSKKEKEFHKAVPHATCLSQIISRVQAKQYESFVHFMDEVDRMVDGSMNFAPDESPDFLLGAIMQSDVRGARKEVHEAGLGHWLSTEGADGDGAADADMAEAGEEAD